MAKKKSLPVNGGLFEDGDTLLQEAPKYHKANSVAIQNTDSICGICGSVALPLFNSDTKSYDKVYCTKCRYKQSHMNTTEQSKKSYPFLGVLNTIVAIAPTIINENLKEQHQDNSIIISRCVHDALAEFGITANPFPVNVKIYSPFSSFFIGQLEASGAEMSMEFVDEKCKEEGIPVFGSEAKNYLALQIYSNPITSEDETEITQSSILDVAIERFTNLEEAIDLPAIAYPLSEAFLKNEEPIQLPLLGRHAQLKTKVIYYFGADMETLDKIVKKQEWKNSWKHCKKAVEELVEQTKKILDANQETVPVQYDENGPFGFKMIKDGEAKTPFSLNTIENK